MKYLIWLFFSVMVLGGFSGREIHQTGAEAGLTHASQNLTLVILASALAMFIVVGAQVLRKEPKYGRWAITFMALGCTYFVSGGISALVYAGTFTPGSLLHLAVGTGSFFGLLGAWFVYRRRHLN
ncbi:hypothetical protein [Saccharospirillum salsuginis]|uniref:Uncharacterized protein n=1 Tax=Saccharospirillum salsuginis TaxID=418750 RepID=A0A918KJZ8_9GAMM|nr:hypothetical protein [Saccharospirillum salsuginis]GGX63881.1 hypothetical protein GCM10007392_34410 [Saccharospirillum salsuginis]